MTRRTVGATALALISFASNSILCRLALGRHAIDALSFTTLRIVAGALALLVLAYLTARRGGPRPERSGSWTGAVALFVYAIAFSLAYLRIGAGLGALVAFGAVQVTMIGFGIARGERPGIAEWVGLAIALGGLLGLGLGGRSTVDPLGAGLMAVAGIAWGVYSLIGRGSRFALFDTAGNFVRATPMALVVTAFTLAQAHGSLTGVLLAVISGAITSGVGYSLWYSALPHLAATRAALLQLCVPVLAAIGAVLLLHETLSPRLVGSGAAILGGVALAVLGKRRAI